MILNHNQFNLQDKDEIKKLEKTRVEKKVDLAKATGCVTIVIFGAVSDLVRRRSRETTRSAHGGERSSRPESSFDA